MLRRRQDLSLPLRASADPPHLRRFRPQTHVLGNRLVAPPLHLPAGRHHVYRRDAVAQRRRPGLGHGPRRVRMDRMEDLMLGSKQTIPLWQQKRRLLTLERALAPDRKDSSGSAITAQAIARARAQDRMAAGSKRKARFSEH